MHFVYASSEGSGESVHMCLRPNKKIPVFRVTRPYLNLLLKPRFFFRFSGKNIIILKGILPFKMHKIIFFPKKKTLLKKVCLLYQNFSDSLPETHLFFIWRELWLLVDVISTKIL